MKRVLKENQIQILENTQRAVINILEDFAEEKVVGDDTQKAVLNILEDFADEKVIAEDTQKAVLNILEDFAEEKVIAEDTQKAVLNILEDFADEKVIANDTQKAVLNILEDFAEEKVIAEDTQKAVLNILEDFAEEKVRAEETQKAVLNILEDYSIEKAKVEKINSKLSQSNKEMEEFSYIASHDLQEPLRTVLNYVKLLQEEYQDKLDDDAKHFLLVIGKATSRMQKLIKDLLSYSRVSSDLTKRKVDCNLILNEVLNDLNAVILESKAEIKSDKLPIVNGYYYGIKSLLQNLISNAIKFRKAGNSPSITVSVQNDPTEWVFAIKDNGIGIHEKYHSKIFVIFQRLHNNDQYLGTGIGLAQCKKIVEKHEGDIWVTSVPEKNTTFYFTIPKTHL